jgi:hypothetical protein
MALSCVARAADGRRGTQVQCQTLPKADWNALCHVSCSALLGSRPAIARPRQERQAAENRSTRQADPERQPMTLEQWLGRVCGLEIASCGCVVVASAPIQAGVDPEQLEGEGGT